MNPLVSIIIPIYNVAEFVERCLESVYNQTYDNIEVILVNDCTPDNTMEIAQPLINKLGQRYAIQIICHEQNRGLSAARNTAIKAMHGDWIYLLDSDDEILSDCIELLVEKTNQYIGVNFVIGGVTVVGGNYQYQVQSLEYISNNRDIVIDYIYKKWYVMAWNKLINREFFIQNDLWFEEGLLHEDELFSFLLALKSQSMACVHKSTYIYKIRKTASITSKKTIVNLTHYLYISKRKLEYIYMVTDSANDIPFYRLAINTAYNFLLDVAGNKNISYLQKKNLALQFKKIFHLEQLKFSNKNLVIKIKSIIVSLDYRLTLLICYIHSIVIQWKYRNVLNKLVSLFT